MLQALSSSWVEAVSSTINRRANCGKIVAEAEMPMFSRLVKVVTDRASRQSSSKGGCTWCCGKDPRMFEVLVWIDPKRFMALFKINLGPFELIYNTLLEANISYQRPTCYGASVLFYNTFGTPPSDHSLPFDFCSSTCTYIEFWTAWYMSQRSLNSSMIMTASEETAERLMIIQLH